MGEEGVIGGMVCYVDLLVEWFEVCVMGLNDNWYVVIVNGCVLLLQLIGIVGEYVVGVCYKVWVLLLVLYLIIGVYVLFMFDIVDMWLQCLFGGCWYYVVYLGGCNYVMFLVNVYEVESCWFVCFVEMGYMLGWMEVVVVVLSCEFLFMLDLWWF